MLRDLDNRFVSLRDYCGELRQPWKNKQPYIVIFSFWATYCKPCKKEIPELEKIAADYPEDVRLLLASIDHTGKRKVFPHVKDCGYQSTVLIDNYQRTAKKYGVKSVPALFVIDKKGIVRYASYGYDEEKGLTELRELLKKNIRPNAAVGVSEKSETLSIKCQPEKAEADTVGE